MAGFFLTVFKKLKAKKPQHPKKLKAVFSQKLNVLEIFEALAKKLKIDLVHGKSFIFS